MAAALDRIRSGIAELPPAYFALVMATGIVSIASELLGYGFIARPLVWLNILFYGGLWGLTAGRIGWYRERFWADLGDHARGPGFFTMIAATCVLGSQTQMVMKAPAAARLLLVLGFFLW
jgi:tellurite resistance protein TehA-like permease